MKFLSLHGNLGLLQRQDGAQFFLWRSQYDVPTEYEIRGEWLPEGHPDVSAAIREHIEKIRERPGCRSAEDIAEIIDDLEWVIQRSRGAASD